MKKIAVVESFFEPHHKQQIEAAAAKCGYAVDYYLDGVLPRERAGEYEIVYGMPDRSALKDMTQLKWFCASFAGVDRYVDEALYPNSAVLLTIPFVGYIFVLDADADAEAFVQTLKDNADPRWNICTEADETIAEHVGNTVFFVMCPA